ncbi:MAG TPA: hypothetical protein VFY83_08760 [Anaerolineales bacterium]|nr:hypothetical protein [Anaerolineales bacterium]
MGLTLSDADWEAMHAHYDQPTYQAVLDQMSPKDIVLDIGAGDLRLARQMARVVRKLYAIEINAQALERADIARDPLPSNLILVCADARLRDFPSDVTTGVLMMRHCTCFPLYIDKLRKVGATRLITNARWRMGVEAIDLHIPRQRFSEAEMGWYACLCGGTGFKEGPAEGWSFEMDRIINEVSSCPRCI